MPVTMASGTRHSSGYVMLPALQPMSRTVWFGFTGQAAATSTESVEAL